MARTNFDQLLQAGCHFGHLKRKWNPAMGRCIEADCQERQEDPVRRY